MCIRDRLQTELMKSGGDAGEALDAPEEPALKQADVAVDADATPAPAGDAPAEAEAAPAPAADAPAEAEAAADAPAKTASA